MEVVYCVTLVSVMWSEGAGLTWRAMLGLLTAEDLKRVFHRMSARVLQAVARAKRYTPCHAMYPTTSATPFLLDPRRVCSRDLVCRSGLPKEYRLRRELVDAR